MDLLENLIKGLYSKLEDSEAIIAQTNLIGLFKKLEAIDKRLLQEESIAPLNKIGNEYNYENIRG